MTIAESVKYNSIFLDKAWHETIYFSVKPSIYIMSSTQQDYQPPTERNQSEKNSNIK